MLSSETVYASQYSSISTILKEIYTFGCQQCKEKKEFVVNHKTK